MIYDLEFLKPALKEWRKLDKKIRSQFKNKLKKRLKNPHVASDKLSGAKNMYKIKLRSSGYRLVYRVIDKEIVVLVIAIGKREKNYVYDLVSGRIQTS